MPKNIDYVASYLVVVLILLIVIMAISLGVGFPVAFALPGSAIITIGTAAFFGYLFESDFGAFFYLGGPSEWLSAGVTNLRGVYWEVERDTLIAIPLFIFFWKAQLLTFEKKAIKYSVMKANYPRVNIAFFTTRPQVSKQ